MSDFKEITFVLTSCNRFDLLEETLKSFVKFNDYPIEKYIFIEDTHKIEELEDVINKFPEIKEKAILLHNEPKLGQMASIDRAYSFVETDYIFHCEEDWEFYNKNFIKDSLSVMQHDEKIVSVWIRAKDDTNGMPIENNVSETKDGTSFQLLETGYRDVWHGFTLNPGLRRTKDYLLGKPFYDKGSEEALSEFYFDKEFRGAILPKGYLKHIGWFRHALDLKDGKPRSKFQYEIDTWFKKTKANFFKLIGKTKTGI